MAKQEGKKSLFGPQMILILGVVWVWFGAQMGSGTACGNNHMNYFVGFGWIGLITVLLAMALEFWMFYWGMELSRVTKAHHFSSWMREVTYPYDKIFVPLFDVLTLIVFPVYIGSCLAGTAEITSQYLGLPYMLALVCAVILFMLIAIYGMKLLAKVQMVLSACIIGVIIYFLIIGIPANFDASVSRITNNMLGDGDVYGSLAWALMYVVLFVAMQFSNLSSMPAAIKGRLHSKMDTKKVVAITGFFLIIVYFAMSFVLLGRWPENLGAEIFTLEAVQALNDPLIQVLYPILLFCAFISTGPVFVFSLTDRWASLAFWDKMDEKNILKRNVSLRRGLIGAIILAIALYISTYGFGFVTHYMFVFTSWAFLPFCFIPMVFIVPFRVRKLRNEAREGKLVTANEIRAAEAAEKGVAFHIEGLGEDEVTEEEEEAIAKGLLTHEALQAKHAHPQE
ncbi:MAG: hypothetical protein Q4D27_02195 [Coriobacteriia bacterium]|nr:hypothetical protein [Coriobacteriia bacterium]